MARYAQTIWNSLIGITGRPRVQRRHRRPATLGRRLRFEQCEVRRMLATFMVNSMTDDGVGTTLREAVDFAVGSLDPIDTITFDQTVFGSGDPINLTQTQLSITAVGSIIIDGGTAGVTITAAANNRIFNITGSGTVTMNKLTLTGGATKAHEKAQRSAQRSNPHEPKLFVSLGDFSWPLLCLAA